MTSTLELLERIQYVQKIKEEMRANEQAMRSSIGTPYYDEIKKYNNGLKDILSDYDIYQQKPMYKCWRCKEEECICDKPTESEPPVVAVNPASLPF